MRYYGVKATVINIILNLNTKHPPNSNNKLSKALIFITKHAAATSAVRKEDPPIRTHPYPSVPIRTHPYPSVPIRTHPYPSVKAPERTALLKTGWSKAQPGHSLSRESNTALKLPNFLWRATWKFCGLSWMQFVFCKTHSEGVYDCTRPSEHRSKARDDTREPQNKKTLDCGNNQGF